MISRNFISNLKKNLFVFSQCLVAYGAAHDNKNQKQTLTKIANIIFEMSDDRIAHALDLFSKPDGLWTNVDEQITDYELLKEVILAKKSNGFFAPALYALLCRYVDHYRIVYLKNNREAVNQLYIKMMDFKGENYLNRCRYNNC